MKITNSFKVYAMAGVLALPMTKQAICATNILKPDVFVRSVSNKGNFDEKTLSLAPSPRVFINGEEKSAKIVIDLKQNILYKFNNSTPEAAYLVATGAKYTPTQEGVRVVTHVETYPYRTAPSNTKRRRTPRAFGPKVICLEKINPVNGEQSSTGQFIHGNNDSTSIGKYASHGCIRMDNEVIMKLAKEVRKGDIVLIKR